MKNFALIIAVFLFGISLQAQKTVTLQRGNVLVSVFDDLTQEVINQAQNDDIIYLSPGVFAGNIDINKRIMLIGVGHSPSSTSLTPGNTTIAGKIVFKNGASGSLLSGLRVTDQIRFGNAITDTLIGIVIERCNTVSIYLAYSNVGRSEGHLIRNNVIAGLLHGYTVSTNCVVSATISNNFLHGMFYFNRNNLIDHNVFTSSNYGIEIVSCSECIFNNNVCFWGNALNSGSSIYMEDSENNTFQNNLFVGFNPSNANNIFQNNKFSIHRDSLFLNYTKLWWAGDYMAFDYNSNYRLKPTCVGVGAATDGTDIGVYGGLSYHLWKENTMPFVPRVSTFTVTPVVPANGLIEIQATVEGQSR